MRWPKPRRAEDQSDTDSVEESPAEPVQTVTLADETTVTEASTEVDEPDRDEQPTGLTGHVRWSRAIAYGVLPGLALLLASAAGFLKWQDASVPGPQVGGAGILGAGAHQTPPRCSPISPTRSRRTLELRGAG